MAITLNPEMREALLHQPERPLIFEDSQTRESYVLMTRAQFQRLVYDDSDLSPEEILAAAAVSASLADNESPDTGFSYGLDATK